MPKYLMSSLSWAAADWHAWRGVTPVTRYRKLDAKRDKIATVVGRLLTTLTTVDVPTIFGLLHFIQSHRAMLQWLVIGALRTQLVGPIGNLLLGRKSRNVHGPVFEYSSGLIVFEHTEDLSNKSAYISTDWVCKLNIQVFEYSAQLMARTHTNNNRVDINGGCTLQQCR